MLLINLSHALLGLLGLLGLLVPGEAPLVDGDTDVYRLAAATRWRLGPGGREASQATGPDQIAVAPGDLAGLRREEREAVLAAARVACERILAGAVARREAVTSALGRVGRQRLHSPDDGFALAAALGVPRVVAVSARRLSSQSVRVSVHAFDARSRREMTLRMLVARVFLGDAVESMTWDLLAGERAREAGRDPDGTLTPSFAAPGPRRRAPTELWLAPDAPLPLSTREVE